MPVRQQCSQVQRFGAHTARRDPELRRFYRRKLVQKRMGKARVAVARKLGIRLWIMLRDRIDYQEFCRRGQKQCGAVCADMPETGYGAVPLIRPPTSLRWREFAEVIMVLSDRRNGWWAAPQ